MKSSWIPIAALLAASATAQSNVQHPNLPQLLDEWRTVHGDGWHYDVDEGTGHLEMLWGSHTTPAFQPSNDAEWFALARAVLAETKPMHGIDGSTLVDLRALFLPLGTVGASDKLTVRFRQVLHGVPVDSGYVNVLFNTAGGMLSVQERALPLPTDFDVRPALTAETATQYAATAFNNDFARRTPTAIDEPELVIAQVEGVEQRVPVLAWRTTVVSEDADLGAVGKTYWIDAKSGRVAMSESAIHNFDVGGTVYTKAIVDHYPDIPGHPATQQVAKYMRLTSSAGTITTDANGNFNYPGVNGPLNITCFYDGTFNDVNNSAGSPYSLVFNAATGSGNVIVLNNTPTALVTAQSNVFWAMNIHRDWIRSINPLDATGDYVHTANVNIASACNAYFTSSGGGSINFYQAGTSGSLTCPNTAFPNVAYHENGHWLNVIYGTGNGSDGMGEGNGDVWAMYIEDDPIVGHDFCGTGCNVRDGLNTRQFCGDANPGCYGEVHADGEVWMGAAWKVRRNLKNALGVGPGGAVANSVFLAWMNAYNQTQIKSIIETQWLILNDNDDTYDNGSPNYAQINPGFIEQGFPGVVLPALAVSNVTKLLDTQNQSGPYTVDATVVSQTMPTTPIASVTLRYKVGSGGSFVNVAMGNVGGNVWSGNIPGQTAPAKVFYYVTASDTAAHTDVHPNGAPTTTYGFKIGVVSTLFCDDFEAAVPGWTVTNTSVTTGAWERGNPIGTGSQPEDDNDPGGTQCYFTDQGVIGGGVGDADVDGGPTVLTSPAFDCTAGSAEISYAYWYSTDDGNDPWRVEISNNGTTWVTVTSTTTGAGGWLTASIDVASFVVPTATVRVRFSAQDNPNDSVTEAAVDSVCVTSLGPVSCPSAFTYCTAKTNSQGCVPAIASSGTASATSATPFNITVSQVLNQKNILLFYGAGATAAPFQGGTLCVQPPLRRTPLSNSGGNPGPPDDCSGTMSFDFNPQIQTSGDPILVLGATINAQYYYRDPADAQTVGLSDGVQFQICP